MRLPGLAFLLAIATTWPMAAWPAYDNQLPQTSQLRAVQGLGTEVTAISGGVRSGHTAAGFEIDPAPALGGP